jgi:adenylate cyclase
MKALNRWIESHGLGNTIQVTESTYQRLKDRYEFEARGVVHIKGEGDMNTYLLRVPQRG